MKADRISPARVERLSRLLRAFVLILLGTLMMMWPTVVNRGPFFFSDTTAYVRGMDAAAYRVLGVSTDWTERFLQRYDGRQAAAITTVSSTGSNAVTLAGRSVYYGALLYIADWFGGLAAVPVLQSLLVALCLYLTTRRFVGRRQYSSAAFLALSATLSVASSVAFFSGFLMPDLYAGTAVLAAAHMLTPSPRLLWGEKLFWFALLSWSALSHSSIIVVLIVVAGSMLLPSLRCGRPTARAIWGIGCAIAVGILGELIFYGAVREFSGNAPVRPPFLMARLVADGPGKGFLRDNCPTSGFVLCHHMEGLSSNSDLILWSPNREQGVFSALPNDERRQIAGEEARFVVAVVADRPLDVLRTSLTAIADQALKWRFSEFNQTPPETSELNAKLPARVQHQYATTRAYTANMPVSAVEVLSLLACAISLMIAVRALSRRNTDYRVKIFLATLLIGIVTNIAVCGALSTPHDRYSTRVLWVLIVGAFVAIVRKREQPRSAPNEPRG